MNFLYDKIEKSYFSLLIDVCCYDIMCATDNDSYVHTCNKDNNIVSEEVYV